MVDGGTGFTIEGLRKHPRLQPISYGEAQARLIRLAAVNEEWASKAGKRGSWLLSPAGLEVLVRMREMERSGASIETALAAIQREGAVPSSAHEASPTYSERGEGELTRENEWLREQVADLRGERDRLLGLLERSVPALPAPRSEPRRRWWERRKP